MNDAGESRKFTVSRIENGRLTVDGNHPLAGKTITFNITVTRIRDASAEEAANGVPPMEMPVLH
jgi:FKBP-type peptidyl-prolyl cis-trans isomerase SlyD